MKWASALISGLNHLTLSIISSAFSRSLFYSKQKGPFGFLIILYFILLCLRNHFYIYREGTRMFMCAFFVFIVRQVNTKERCFQQFFKKTIYSNKSIFWKHSSVNFSCVFGNSSNIFKFITKPDLIRSRFNFIFLEVLIYPLEGSLEELALSDGIRCGFLKSDGQSY